MTRGRHVVLHEEKACRRTALAGAVEGRGQHIADRLFRQGRGVDDHRVHAAGLGDQRRDGAIARRQRPVDEGGRVVGAGKGHARQGGMGQHDLADPRAVARQELQHLGRHAGLVQQPHRFMGDQRRLLRGLGHHAVAGSQCGRDLSREDRDREVPRRDAGKDAAPVQRDLVALAGGAGQQHWTGKLGPAALRIVAQEVHRLAQVGHGIVQSLARLAHQQRHQADAVRLVEIGGALENRRARHAALQVPAMLRRGCSGHGPAPRPHRRLPAPPPA